jgi:hypothetical protein
MLLNGFLAARQELAAFQPLVALPFTGRENNGKEMSLIGQEIFDFDILAIRRVQKALADQHQRDRRILG